MSNLIYLIIVLTVAFYSLVYGFRKGITGQLSSLLGFAFGAVSARILTPDFIDWFQWTSKFCQAPEFREFTSNLVCGVVIYFVVFEICLVFTSILRKALSVFRTGMFNRLLGGVFSLFKNLLWLSIILNLFLCFSDESRLLRYETSNDGNLIAAVMAMTPAILGCYGAEDFAHFHQLREAKSISCNFNDKYIINCNYNKKFNVILAKGKSYDNVKDTRPKSRHRG